MSNIYQIGAVGCGRMGMRHIRALAESDRWELTYVCDLSEDRLKAAGEAAPEAALVTEYQTLLDDPTIDAVSLNTLSNVRPGLIRQAVAAGKHVICEKPLAPTATEASELLADLAGTDRLITTNLINRNAPYVREARAFVQEGQIGDLAVIRIDHNTAGLPMDQRGDYSHRGVEGHVLHDCGMHYVDVMRWFAESEYDAFESRGVHFWGDDYQAYFMAQGRFVNGIMFDVHNTHCYTSLAETRRHNCRQEFIGSHGVITLTHDFLEVTLRMNGRSRTVEKTVPYAGKNLDVYYREFADAIDTGDLGALPRVEDAVIASEVSQRMVDDALARGLASFGAERSEVSAIRSDAAAAR